MLYIVQNIKERSALIGERDNAKSTKERSAVISANGTVASREWSMLKVRQKRKKKRDEPIRKRKRLKERSTTSKDRQHDSNKKAN